MFSTNSLEDESGRTMGFDPSEFFFKFKIPITMFLLGMIAVGFGVLAYKYGLFSDTSKVEVLGETEVTQKREGELFVEISGAVSKPGVYKLPFGARVEDLLISSGGLAQDADRNWVDKYINRAAKLTDGQKLYIQSLSDQSEGASANNDGGVKVYQPGVVGVSSQGVNINTASQKELEELPGIGPVYAQNIIEHRPYSTVEDLLTKEALKENVYEKVKDKVIVY